MTIHPRFKEEWEKNHTHGNPYKARAARKTLVHVGYESVTDDTHKKSPHMRQRIAGVVHKECRNCIVIHLSEDTEESQRNCVRIRPNIAIISSDLPENDGVTLNNIIRSFIGRGVRVIVLHKKQRPTLEQGLLKLDLVHFVNVKSLKRGLASLLTIN